MLISEIYKSVQGEGLLTGTESIFLRTSGCNLRCGFCDTPYTSWHPEGDRLSLDEIVQQCIALDCQHVVVTGGEPMIQKGIVELTDRLARLGLHLTIETAGTVNPAVKCDLMSISPKLSNSVPSASRDQDWAERHDRLRHQPQVIRGLIDQFEYQIKFVVDEPADGQEVLTYLEEFPEIRADRVLLMPEGVKWSNLEEKVPWIRAFADQHGFRVCQRMHILWFGNRRGT